jgi:segregation and condensation protein A
MDGITSYTGFTVKHESFEGPFELILDLIEKRKLSVNDLSLSQVTDDYIAFVHGHDAFPMEEAAQFIGVAATLLLIKSRSLIPDLELSTEEEGDVDDLKRRLMLYEKIRETRGELGRVFGRAPMHPAGERTPEPVFAPSRDFTLERLGEALAGALASLEKEVEKLPEARVRPLVTIEEMMDTLLMRVQAAMTVSFRDFANGTKEKVEVVVSFLALLELVKQGAVEALQHESFADIRITNTSAGVPRY